MLHTLEGNFDTEMKKLKQINFISKSNYLNSKLLHHVNEWRELNKGNFAKQRPLEKKAPP